MSKAWANGSTTAWRKVRAACLARDNYICQLRRPGCTTRATTADHTVAKSNGGADTLSNLKAACVHCNTSKGASTPALPHTTLTTWENNDDMD